MPVELKLVYLYFLNIIDKKRAEILFSHLKTCKTMSLTALENIIEKYRIK
jgi:hypothetical protein